MDQLPGLLGLVLQHFFLIVLAGLFLTLLLCYTLQAIAEKLEVSASWMAWVPLLQIHPLIKSGGGSFLHLLTLTLAALPAAVAASALGPFGIAILLGYCAWALAWFGRLFWTMAVLRGVSGWLGILAMLPGVGLMAYFYIAFHDGPVVPSKLGMVLGAVFFVLPALPQLENARRLEELGGQFAALTAASEAGDARSTARTMLSMFQALREEDGSESEGEREKLSQALSELAASAFGKDADPAGSDASPELEALSTSFACPEGTQERGAAPPAGHERWCERGGVRQGGYASWYPNGQLRESGTYRDGRRAGVWTRWFASGGKQAQAEFEGGVENGLVLTWDEYGRPQQTARFHEGKPTGS